MMKTCECGDRGLALLSYCCEYCARKASGYQEPPGEVVPPATEEQLSRLQHVLED
jgi:hypothetical protein